MSRRHPDQPRGRAETPLERAVAARFSIAPGEVTASDIRAYAEMTAPKAPKAGRDGPRPLAALLDGYDWARSWGSFLAAIRDPKDGQGARAAIMKVQAARPRNAWTERVPSQGGFLVPWSLTEQILALMMPSIVRPRCTLVPMDAYRVGTPVLDSTSQADGAQALAGVTFSFTPDGQPITASAPTFDQVVLEANADKALIQNVPNELLADGTTFTSVFLPKLIAQGLAWHVDDVAIYQGTGVAQPQALVNAGGAVQVTRNTSDEVLHMDVVAMLKALHPASKATATWLASEDTFDQLLELYEIVGTAPTGQDIPPPGTLKYNSDSRRWELLGLEIVPNDHQPAVGTTGDLMLADLEWLLLGELQEMTVDISSKGAGFISDTSSIRVRYRWDSRFALPQTITLANGKVTSPLVVLAAAA